jgi:NAD(P)-dependent dehydrogenase (short-subunit alcohol dehydrogenase family)
MVERIRVAIVTGAAQGIGESIAECLAADGVAVIVNDTNVRKASSVVEQLIAKGYQAHAVQADVSVKSEVDALVAETLQKFGPVNILVNNAALLHETPFEKIEEEEWDRVIAVNLKGPFLCSKAILSGMKKQCWGRIINITSLAGQAGGLVAGAHYSASKGGLISLTKVLARQFATYGITVNAVAPAAIRTPKMDEVDPIRLKSMVAQIPVGRVGEAIEIGGIVAFLASERASFVTGATIDINGGLLMR